MRLFGYLLLACVMLSLVQAALSALLIVVVILLVIGVFTHPAETFGFLTLGLLSWLFQTHPIAAVWLVSLLAIAGIVLRKVPADTSKVDPPLPAPAPSPLLTADTAQDDQGSGNARK